MWVQSRKGINSQNIQYGILNERIKKVNSEFINNIVLQKQQEKIQDASNKRDEIANDLAEKRGFITRDLNSSVLAFSKKYATL